MLPAVHEALELEATRTTLLNHDNLYNYVTTHSTIHSQMIATHTKRYCTNAHLSSSSYVTYPTTRTFSTSSPLGQANPHDHPRPSLDVYLCAFYIAHHIVNSSRLHHSVSPHHPSGPPAYIIPSILHPPTTSINNASSNTRELLSFPRRE